MKAFSAAMLALTVVAGSASADDVDLDLGRLALQFETELVDKPGETPRDLERSGGNSEVLQSITAKLDQMSTFVTDMKAQLQGLIIAESGLELPGPMRWLAGDERAAKTLTSVQLQTILRTQDANAAFTKFQEQAIKVTPAIGQIAMFLQDDAYAVAGLQDGDLTEVFGWANVPQMLKVNVAARVQQDLEKPIPAGREQKDSARKAVLTTHKDKAGFAPVTILMAFEAGKGPCTDSPTACFAVGVYIEKK